MTVFIHITSFTKNDKKYGVSYIVSYMRVYVGKILHLFHKMSHIRDNICIKSVTFGPSHTVHNMIWMDNLSMDITISHILKILMDS